MTGPTFKDVAQQLRQRLAGRLLVAHNARFDYAFLKAEFERARVDFSSEVLCTVLLSRRLYPEHACHDLDALMERHGLAASVRHRALPDARLVWEFWQAIHRELPRAIVADAVSALLAGPVLPDHLDPALIERLPEAPGVYVFHGPGDEILGVGEARNLKAHLTRYFRLDRVSTKALAMTQRIQNVSWRATQGMLGARVQRVGLEYVMSARQQAMHESSVLWRLRPEQRPCCDLVPVDSVAFRGTEEHFGLSCSERKARNALVRLAQKHYLCHALLGIPEEADSSCLACPDRAGRRFCGAKEQRPRHLMKIFLAMKPLRIAAWPYAGPIGVRERHDVHVFDNWRYLGSGRNESEVAATLSNRPSPFNRGVFTLLTKRLARLRPSDVICLQRVESCREPDASESPPSDSEYSSMETPW